jgi:hypothetical protein
VYLENCNDALSIWATAGFADFFAEASWNVSCGAEGCRGVSVYAKGILGCHRGDLSTVGVL